MTARRVRIGGALGLAPAITAAGCNADACGMSPPIARTTLSAARTTAPPGPEDRLQLVRDGDAVFFVGNSFFGWQDRPLPAWIEALGAVLDPPIHLETGQDIVFGNRPLGEFLSDDPTRQALASGRYDVFVLQAEEFEPVDDPDGFAASVRAFDREVRNAGARTVLFMTWEFPWRPFIDELATAYDRIGSELGIPVIPAGLVYWDCGQAPIRPDLPRHWLTATADHPQGDLHQNAHGTAVNTYTTFQLLTGIDPAGVNFAAPGNTNTDAEMAYFSAQAWQRVVPRLPTHLYTP